MNQCAACEASPCDQSACQPQGTRTHIHIQTHTHRHTHNTVKPSNPPPLLYVVCQIAGIPGVSMGSTHTHNPHTPHCLEQHQRLAVRTNSHRRTHTHTPTYRHTKKYTHITGKYLKFQRGTRTEQQQMQGEC